ncbi:hypothetical protein [Arthrobacter sp. CG_A4]|uniref:hypothetical protein n=1 Tax=Arthrobacter sp. CG_A4 TaxID=3071706 RepID=UPI002E004932|nr:hypothetical protein [Arthrobacter sp. CG_A4]
MSGIEDLLPQSIDRWAKAARRAQGIADVGLGSALKAYFTRWFPAGVIVLVLQSRLFWLYRRFNRTFAPNPVNHDG